MPEGAGGSCRLAGFGVVHVGRDDRHLRRFRMMEAGQYVRRQGTEAAAHIQQPVEVVVHVGDDDGEMLQQRLLDNAKIRMGKCASRIDAAEHGAEGRIQSFNGDAHAARLSRRRSPAARAPARDSRWTRR